MPGERPLPCRSKAIEKRQLSLQSLAQRFRRLPGLLVPDVGIAHRGADILVAKELLDFPQILSHMVKEDRRRGMRGR